MKQLSILAIFFIFFFTLLSVSAQPLLRIDLPEKAMPGEIIIVQLRPSNFDDITSLQFSLQWPTDDLELIETVSTLPQIYPDPDIGILTASWFDANAVSWPNDSTILTLHFKIKKCSERHLHISAYDIPLAASISNLELGEEVPFPITSDTLQVCRKEIFANQDSTICSGSSVSLYANCDDCTYMWSTGATTDTIVVDMIGTYTLEITDTSDCVTKDTIHIFNYPLQPIGVSGDSLICVGSTTDLIATADFNHYAWSNGMNGQSINTGAGTYALTATNTQGCTATTQFVVNEIFKNIFTNQDSTICSGSSMLLYADCDNCTYMWSTGATTDTIVVDMIGMYALKTTDTLNCVTKDTIHIFNYPLQPIGVSGDSLICAASTTKLSATTGFDHYAWSNGMNGQSINAGAGTYSLTATNTQGCTATTQFVVDEIFKNIFTNQDSTICSGGSMLLYTDCDNCTYMWSTGATTDTIVVDMIGTYTLEITDTSDCVTKDTIHIFNYPLQAIKVSGDSLICAGSTTDLIAVADFSHYAWSNGMTENTINAGAGTYSLTATNAKGCTATTQFIVNQTSEINALIDIIPPLCEGETAEIDIIANGGLEPYKYQFGSGSFGNDPVFQDIDPGTHSIKVRDALGCEYAFSVDIKEPEIWVASINPRDTATYTGDTVQLNIASNQPIASINWLSSEGVSCFDCLNPFVVASQSQVYQVEIVNQHGCLKMLEARIEIKTDPDPRSIYIPNAFAPDTYGDNSQFKIFYDPTYVKTLNLTIFDRWGNMIAAPPQTSKGWNGYYNGSLMETGIYIYVVQLEYSDGEKETLSGDITLLR
jgi:gliding motility-associated-like protein